MQQGKPLFLTFFSQILWEHIRNDTGRATFLYGQYNKDLCASSVLVGNGDLAAKDCVNICSVNPRGKKSEGLCETQLCDVITWHDRGKSSLLFQKVQVLVRNLFKLLERDVWNI